MAILQAENQYKILCCTKPHFYKINRHCNIPLNNALHPYKEKEKSALYTIVKKNKNKKKNIVSCSATFLC